MAYRVGAIEGYAKDDDDEDVAFVVVVVACTNATSASLNAPVFSYTLTGCSPIFLVRLCVCVCVSMYGIASYQVLLSQRQEEPNDKSLFCNTPFSPSLSSRRCIGIKIH